MSIFELESPLPVGPAQPEMLTSSCDLEVNFDLEARGWGSYK